MTERIVIMCLNILGTTVTRNGKIKISFCRHINGLCCILHTTTDLHRRNKRIYTRLFPCPINPAQTEKECTPLHFQTIFKSSSIVNTSCALLKYYSHLQQLCQQEILYEMMQYKAVHFLYFPYMAYSYRI